MPHDYEVTSLNLNTKPITSQRMAEDGIRLSVMSRHTLQDGITPDNEIAENSFDEHWPELGPPPKLIGDWYKRGLLWDDFARRYNAYLETVPKQVESLLGLLVCTQTVTLLCIEPEPEHCHRRLLAEYCQEWNEQIRLHIQ